jgi:hypothetical protein
MGDVVMVPLPVSAEAAAALEDEARRAKVGKLVSDLLRPGKPADDPFAILIADLKATARRDGLTDEEIDAELTAYNAERRL